MDGTEITGGHRKKYRVGQLISIRSIGSNISKIDVWSEPAFKNSSAFPIGLADAGDICVVLEVCYYSYKILTQGGLVGWVDWVDVYDPVETS